MNNSNPVTILVASVMVTLFSLKIKADCYFCFLGVFFIGLILFIFGLVKYWKRYNG